MRREGKVKYVEGVLGLIDREFTDSDVKDVALYMVSSVAIGEAANTSIMMGEKEVKGLPPQALDVAVKYDAGLTTNEFFMKHFTTLRTVTIIDRIKIAATNDLLYTANATGDKNCYRKAREMMVSKLDSLITLALLWKGYDYACDFAAKLKLAFDLTPEAEQFFIEHE